MYNKRSILLALAGVGVLLAGCGEDSSDPATDTETNATEAAFNTADVEFTQQMIPHHAQAVEMAQVVPGQDVSPELLDLAEAVEAAQQPEIDQMTAMLERWGEDVPSTDGDGHDMAGMDDMAGMEGMMSAEDMDALSAATGAAFEQMWLAMMIEHHEGAISMSETELADGSDSEAQTLAQEIIDAQEAEIVEMERMLGGSSGTE